MNLNFHYIFHGRFINFLEVIPYFLVCSGRFQYNVAFFGFVSHFFTRRYFGIMTLFKCFVLFSQFGINAN